MDERKYYVAWGDGTVIAKDFRDIELTTGFVSSLFQKYFADPTLEIIIGVQTPRTREENTTYSEESD